MLAWRSVAACEQGVGFSLKRLSMDMPWRASLALCPRAIETLGCQPQARARHGFSLSLANHGPPGRAGSRLEALRLPIVAPTADGTWRSIHPELGPGQTFDDSKKNVHTCRGGALLNLMTLFGILTTGMHPITYSLWLRMKQRTSRAMGCFVMLLCRDTGLEN